MRLKLLGKLGGLAYAHKKNAGCKRIECSGMPDFQILLSEMTDCGELDLSDHVRRSPSVWFVYRDYYSLRIVVDAS